MARRKQTPKEIAQDEQKKMLSMVFDYCTMIEQTEQDGGTDRTAEIEGISTSEMLKIRGAWATIKDAAIASENKFKAEERAHDDAREKREAEAGTPSWEVPVSSFEPKMTDEEVRQFDEDRAAGRTIETPRLTA